MKIAIFGAGVGGLSTAIALKKKGFDIDIYERTEKQSHIGAGIVCWPNATFVLGELGLLNDVKKVSGLPGKMCRYSDTNEDLGSIDIQALNKKMGALSYSILRKDLMCILSDHASKLGVTVNYQHEITQITTSPDNEAEVHFKNGKTIKADLIIGADGRMNSITRKYVNDNNAPVYQGFINWIGVIDSRRDIFSEVNVSDYWGVGKRFGIVPITLNKAYWAGAVSSPTIDDNKPGTYKQELISLFQNWPQPITEIIEQTQQENINKIYVHDHNPIKTWHKNNVLLIGDAAHAPLPTSGQGACQALEDAWQLAQLLDKDFTELEPLFNTFTKIRYSKTEGIMMGARQFATSLFNTDLDACKQRNLNSQSTDYDAVVNGMSKGWANGLPIGDHPQQSTPFY